MSVNGEIYNAYNLYNNKNTIAIVPRENFTKKNQIIINIQNKGTIALLRKPKKQHIKKVKTCVKT